MPADSGGEDDEPLSRLLPSANSAWDCPGCPPPYFDLPPPPLPPFLDPDEAHCSSPYASCDSADPSVIVVDDSSSPLGLESDLLTALVVVIASLVLVMLALLVACVVWRSVQVEDSVRDWKLI